MNYIIGDSLALLKTMPAKSIQCVVTSPPYYALRSYLPEGHPSKALEIGSESSLDAFVATMVRVFREVRRVLRDDGTLWLNLGDGYAANGVSGLALKGASSTLVGSANVAHTSQRKKAPKGIPPKNLLLVPARVALALQADGWILRSDIIWHKPNPMPESCRDRPTSAHEHMFLFAKKGRYFFDQDAVREPVSETTLKDKRIGAERVHDYVAAEQKYGAGMSASRTKAGSVVGSVSGRNLRNVWKIPSQPVKHKHYATFPEKLVTPCIKAGSRPGDTVLDPFMGSGTVAIVAERLGRSWIGLDLDERNYHMAELRLAEARTK